MYNEMARLSHLATFDQKDLCFYTAFRCLSLVMDFVQFELRELPEALTEEVLTWIDGFSPRFAEFLQSLEKGGDAENWQSTSKVCGELMIKWRQDWMRYGQIVQVVSAVQASPPPKTSLKEELLEKRRPES
jgi:hypothetical protein